MIIITTLIYVRNDHIDCLNNCNTKHTNDVNSLEQLSPITTVRQNANTSTNALLNHILSVISATAILRLHFVLHVAANFPSVLLVSHQLKGEWGLSVQA
jgi:hypothetical protein